MSATDDRFAATSWPLLSDRHGVAGVVTHRATKQDVPGVSLPAIVTDESIEHVDGDKRKQTIGKRSVTVARANMAVEPAAGQIIVINEGTDNARVYAVDTVQCQPGNRVTLHCVRTITTARYGRDSVRA